MRGKKKEGRTIRFWSFYYSYIHVLGYVSVHQSDV